ncbi:MAG: metallophosphoesterase [Prevotella sp.]
MITKIVIPLLLAILLPWLYIDLQYLKRRIKKRWMRILWWVPAAVMATATLLLGNSRNFAPDNISIINTYLFMVGFMVVPATLFVLCSLVGRLLSCLCHTTRNYGHIVGTLSVLGCWYILIYGCTKGFNQITVKHLTYYSDQLPDAFDGYRIVHFSDLHAGTYSGSHAPLLKRAVDSINAQCADLIVFTGDLQNRMPSEILPHHTTLSQLHAKDGVISVMGNHDYPHYITAEDKQKESNLEETKRLQRSMGWTLLLNSHIILHRDADSIIVAGMENDGTGRPFPSYGDIRKTMQGTRPGQFILMLQHDPSSWRRTVLPHSSAQLTLSGHTHATQFSLFNWSPASLIYKEWGGMYYEGKRAIHVSTGLGGFIPFRFGVPGEVTVITLKKKQALQSLSYKH